MREGLIVFLVVLIGLSKVAAEPDPTRPVEAHTLGGQALFRPQLPDAVRQDFEAKLAVAVAEYEQSPNADHLIWVGRRTAYLGRYQEAIEIFTQGIDSYPDDPRFLRHRGHRYLSTRQFDRAVEDLGRAAEMIAGQPDQVEPDGLPNARNTPTSTLQTNIWYHLGLAHYLLGDFEQALLAYEACLRVSKNPDMLSATRYWLYLTQAQLGRQIGARTNLAAVGRNWDIIENHSYYRLLLLFRGDLELAEVLGDGSDPLQDATLAYGLGNWYLLRADRVNAERSFEALLASDQWNSFAYIAAEADRYRRNTP